MGSVSRLRLPGWLMLGALLPAWLQAGPSPQQEGRAVMEAACLQCHSLRPLAMARGDRSQWEEVVYEMISHGAQLLPAEIDPLLDYLSRAFGPAPAGTPDTPPAAGPASESLPAGRGRSVLEGACAGCHDLAQAVSFRGDEAGWGALVDRMIGYGARLSPADRTELTAYLARHLGQQPAGSGASDGDRPVEFSSDGDRGRQLVGVACLQCHSLRPLAMVRGGREEWEAVVYEMISHGAQIAPDEIDPILDYLARAYPPAP